MYREAGRIEATIAGLAAHPDLLHDTELILVDDGSDDDTADLAEAALSSDDNLRGRVLRLKVNRGKGGAIAAGVAHAGGATVAFADADLSTGPSAISQCFAAVESGLADVVVTSRHAAGSQIVEAAPTSRRLSTALFRRLLASRVGLDRFTDTQCGLKGFTQEAARTLFTDLTVQRFAFDVEVLLRAEMAGLKVIEMPVEWHHVDDSKVRPVRDGARMAVDVMRLRGRVKRWQSQSGDVLPVLAVLERRHWWFVSHRDLVSDAVVASLAPDERGLAVDAAAGTGSVTDRLGELGFARRLAVDPGPRTVSFGRGPKDASADLVAGDFESLPVADGQADLVVAVDTLANTDDDVAALSELVRVLRPGGTVVVTGPGMRSVWSEYDVALGHRRRYDRDDLRVLFDQVGIELIRVTHFHAWLHPLTFLLQRTPLGRLFLQKPEDSTFVDARVNRVLRGFVALERALTRRFDLPFGQAVMAVGRRRRTT